MSKTLEELSQTLLNLSIQDALSLRDMLCQKMGVSPEALSSAGAGASGEQEEVKKTAEATFKVILRSYPADKQIAALKSVKDALGLGIADAKKILDTAVAQNGVDIKGGLSEADAKKLIELISASGAILESVKE